MHTQGSASAETPAMTPDDVVAFLRRPGSYPEKTDHVELIETHISWVFLTDRFAYKLKKPVRFEFVDFSDIEARHRACEDELRLNRRLAPDVYLQVLPVIWKDDGHLALGGRGGAVDWVVKMRRLNADQSLDRLIHDARLGADQVNRVAAILADFYAQAAPLTILPREYHAEIERHVRANAAELARPEHGADAAEVRRIHAAQLRFLRLQRALFDERVCDGRIIEGHGDLRPEHIYLEASRPLVIDCVEFSRELRTLDVADELCFLAMECDRLGAEQMGRRVIEVYRQRCNDLFPDSLLAFYKAYRACVRAKVTVLRARQLPSAQRAAATSVVSQYLALAEGYARQLGPPLVLVVCGLMGSGKSTLAAALAETLSLEMLSTDTARQELLPRAVEPAGYNQGNYAPELRRRVYDELLNRARQRVDQGASLVLDGTFLTNELRRAAVGLAQQAGAIPLLVSCRCDPAVAKARIAARLAAGSSPSEARPELFTAQAQEDEPPTVELPSLTVDTTASLDDQVAAVIDRLTH